MDFLSKILNDCKIVSYFFKKLGYLKGLWIYLCMYLIRQFWRWNNEISKACYQETQKSGSKQLLFSPVNWCNYMKIFRLYEDFQTIWRFSIANDQLGNLELYVAEQFKHISIIIWEDHTFFHSHVAYLSFTFGNCRYLPMG